MHLRWKKTWTDIAFWFALTRIAYLAAGVIARSVSAPAMIADDSIFRAASSLLRNDLVSRLLVNPWMRWDTGWYLKIAAFGYGATDSSTVFMPMYPLVVRLAAGIFGGNYLMSALVVSNLACLVSLLLLYEVALEQGLAEDAATRVVGVLLLFPTAFFLFAAYTESLFLAPLLGAWLLARRKHWLAAGILAALATLTRMQGVIMSPVLLWIFLADWASARELGPIEQVKHTVGMVTTRAGWASLVERLRRPDWVALLLPLFTFAAYNIWLRWAGMMSIVGGLQSGWENATVMPWTGFWLFLQRLISRQNGIVDIVDLLSIALALGLSAYGLARLDPALSIYNWLTLALIMMGGSTPHLLDSFSRYFLALFPAFLLMAMMRNRPLRWSVGAISLSVQMIFLLAFLEWRWVG